MSAVDDPNRWINDLVRGLAASDAAYQAAPAADKRYHATDALLKLTTYLMTIPALADGLPFASLKDIASMLWDLESGKKHPWSVPTNIGGTSQLGTAKQELKRRAVVAVEIMTGAGYGTNEACREIAGILTKSGRLGRQDSAGGREGKFSDGTVKRWCRECSPDGTDPRGCDFVTRELESYRSHPDWPPTRANALAFAKRTLNHALLRDRFIS